MLIANFPNDHCKIIESLFIPSALGNQKTQVASTLVMLNILHFVDDLLAPAVEKDKRRSLSKSLPWATRMEK